MEKAKKPKSKFRKILDGIIFGVFGTILAGVLVFNIANRIAGEDGMLFGTQCPVVLTDSMEPEYKVKDVLIVKKVNPEDIQVGDDISFYYDIFGIGEEMSVTHRISKIEIHEDVEVGRGHYTFTAHGINKQSEQCGGGDCTYQTQTFNETKIIGRVEGKSAFLSAFYKLMGSVAGLLIFILIPCLYLVITSVLDIVKTLKESEEASINGEVPTVDAVPVDDKNDPLKGLSEDEKEALKKQMLDEILKGKK